MKRSLGASPDIASRARNINCRRRKYLASHTLWSSVPISLEFLYDASAKLGSGILNGNINQFGDYDQCLSVRHDQLGISGQYCLALIFVELRNSGDDPNLATVLDLAQSYQAMPSSFGDKATILPTFSTVSWGVCVPSGCSSSDVAMALTAALHSHNLTLDIHVEVDQDSCEVYRPRKLLQGGAFITL
ncbi:hypothetical protein J6590_084648 [Homalodisca vitripennis]|nr:hypothetical protein J6590_084648 [Homalodisca vitripennis]